jgi:MFS family permease
MYLCLFLSGVGAAFSYPATAALLPQAVPLSEFANAVTWNSTGFQVASVTGPALGGAVIAFTRHAAPVYVIDAALALAFVVCVLLIAGRQGPRSMESPPTRARCWAARARLKTDVIWRRSPSTCSPCFGGATTSFRFSPRTSCTSDPRDSATPRRAVGRSGTDGAGDRPPATCGTPVVTCSGRSSASTGDDRLRALAILSALDDHLFTGALDNVSVVIRQSLVQMRAPTK